MKKRQSFFSISSFQKRKRSTSVEEVQQTITTDTDSANGHTATSRSRCKLLILWRLVSWIILFFLDGRSLNRDDEAQITDDEDNNNHNRDTASTEQDTTEIEQQKKRRRTANYQHILSTKPTNAPDGDDDHDERTSSHLSMSKSLLIILMFILVIFWIATADNFRSLSTRRGDHSSSITQNPDERMNRFTPVKQRFDILPTYRTPTSNYDPTKSPLFSAGNRVSAISYVRFKRLCFFRRELLPSQTQQQLILNLMNFLRIIC